MARHSNTQCAHCLFQGDIAESFTNVTFPLTAGERRLKRHSKESQFLPSKLLSNFDFTIVPGIEGARYRAS